MAHAQTVADLEKRNKMLLAEIDKLQTQVFELQTANAHFKDAMADKSHTEQLAGWAMDRALEAAKLFPAKPLDVTGLVEIAKQICDGVKTIAPERPITGETKESTQETIQ